MKKLLQIGLFFIGVVSLSSSQASMEQKTVNKPCYIFKNNHLINKGICENEHSEGYVGSDTYEQDIYKLGGKSLITVDTGFDGGKRYLTLNNKKALEQSRMNTDFKIISAKTLADLKKKNTPFLECVKSKQNSLEICTSYFKENHERDIGSLATYK